MNNDDRITNDWGDSLEDFGDYSGHQYNDPREDPDSKYYDPNYDPDYWKDKKED